MSDFSVTKEETFGSINAKLYSYDETQDELNNYIKSKIQRPVNHINELLNNYASPDVDKTSLSQRFEELSKPTKHSIPAFDVKRSTVTEFMAEFLLEQEFQCIFFEQANKKINKSLVDINRHSAGVDVVGIQETQQNLKFVVAEIKASKDNAIPCSSANHLKEDVNKILDFTNDKLLKEIVGMCQSLGASSQQYAGYIKFLFDLIDSEKSQAILVKSIIIFPFLIRHNPTILEKKTLQDFRDFSELETKNVETIGIVWAINKDVDSFVRSIYSDG